MSRAACYVARLLHHAQAVDQVEIHGLDALPLSLQDTHTGAAGIQSETGDTVRDQLPSPTPHIHISKSAMQLSMIGQSVAAAGTVARRWQRRHRSRTRQCCSSSAASTITTPLQQQLTAMRAWGMSKTSSRPRACSAASAPTRSLHTHTMPGTPQKYPIGSLLSGARGTWRWSGAAFLHRGCVTSETRLTPAFQPRCAVCHPRYLSTTTPPT